MTDKFSSDLLDASEFLPPGISKESYKELIDLFIDQASVVIDSMEELNSFECFDELRDKAHSIASSAAQLSAKRLSELLYQIENLEVFDKDTICLTLKGINAEFESVKRKFSSM